MGQPARRVLWALFTFGVIAAEQSAGTIYVAALVLWH